MMQDEAANAGKDQVTDDELLYRRIPRNTPETQYYDRSGGRLRVLAQSFSERAIAEGQPFAGEYRLSVDRAKLRGFDPNITRQGVPGRAPETFGVVVLPADEVRNIVGVADIVPDPIINDPDLPDNLAHALICVSYNAGATKTANKNVYRNVIQELAAAANRRPWAINPPDDAVGDFPA